MLINVRGIMENYNAITAPFGNEMQETWINCTRSCNILHFISGESVGGSVLS